MRIVTGSDIGRGVIHDSVVTIGNFDGVHRGHQEIFRRLMACGLQRGLQSVVVTFEPHPLKVLSSEDMPPLITTYAQKTELIAAAGVEFLVVVPFTAEFAGMTAEDFVRDILCDSLGMRHIIIGHDYAFGKGRAGNYATLERIGGEKGFTLEDMDPIGEDGVVFSSSLARRLIAAGDMEAVSGVLGRYHLISGTVVHGRDIGHSLGFPTANISTDNELLPPDGVYAVLVSIDGRLVKGACSIGLNPTFEGGARTIEVFLLDYADQIYGREMVLCFVQRLRGIIKFPDAEALVDAISQDVLHTRNILATVDLQKVNPVVRMGMNEHEI
ncbi:MAG: bifunctional riboflavin kinase/FAD synthetase [Desulfobacteraceae bacterium]|nr:bifunctional riboflavin kinase/FAD synthetase [Desulfobacteraceae bacterium]